MTTARDLANEFHKLADRYEGVSENQERLMTPHDCKVRASAYREAARMIELVLVRGLPCAASEDTLRIVGEPVGEGTSC